jgi:uncharacterized repeat protein (TIGR01451 family)
MKIQKEKNKNVHKIRTGKFNKSKNKKLIIGAGILVGLVMLLGIFVLIFSVNRNNQTLSGKTEELNAGGIVNGDKGYISSAQIIQTKTGTGPWDANDEPGNDSSEDNNIVRSFDQVTWTVDLTMALKSGVVDSGLTGGIINVEATLPETCADVMKWDLDSMKWIEKGNVSTDGRTLTGQYSMLETETTIPGKQTLVFVLGVEGAGNKTEIIPTFTFELEGNEENDKVTITGDKIIVSAKGKYNIKLNRNVQLADKTTVDYGEGNTSGRMYGYSFELQIYNENESKELKGIEYPNGDITFDIDLKLERSRFGSNELEDITDEATPILWNYRVNDWTSTNIEGNIPGRNMHTGNGYFLYNLQVPLGKFREAEYSTYNSGNIKITQEGSSLKVVVSDYKLNGTFPYYESSYSGNTHRSKIYTENIGTFSVGYMQIFVPDTEASTIENRNYYLTVSDSNMRVTSITNQILTSQMSTSDDTSRISHVIYSPGTYSHITYFYDTNFKLLSTTTSTGDSKETIGNIVMALSKFDISLYSDNDIYTANKFYKFDGECFEPIYYNNARYIKRNMGGNAQFRVWYVTKKDGKNWTSQTELNNANIEDMDIYDNIEDIPENKICVGVYVESIDGYISKYTGDNNGLVIPLKIKETATIGSTYSINVRTQVWTYQLDRNIYSIVHPENKYPTPTWDSGNLQYIKTEYDENGEIISGTHNGGARWGNTLLAIGANLHGEIKAINGSNEEKVNYDLGKNESIVTYSVEPQLDGNTNITSQIENVTLKAEVTLPQGLTYIPGSSEYGEPEITNNSNGSQTLIWYIYGVISGQAIEPIRFNAQIDNESENGQQYETKFVISEVIGTDGISKIGNSKVDFRTSTETINVINLASHRLYKEVEIPIIEKNGQIKYNISYSNNTDETVSDFQLLDILPYNGDSRGTEFEGTYMLESVKVNQMISASTQSTDNLQLFTTNSDNVKSMTAKDTGIGVDSIWSEKTIGASLNENTTGFAIKGEIVGKSRLDIEITLNTTGNAPENVYANNAMAQVYTDSEQMQTGTVQAQVVSRKIQGKVWEDSNRNGVIDSSEKYLEGTTVKLLNSTNNAEVTRTTTNAQGEYEFTDLAKGTYKVEVAIDDLHELTDKEVGTNKEINSKFNQSTKQTDEITKLNTISSPEIIEENVNAGIRTIQYNINTKVEGAGGNISGEGQDIYESVDKGENSVKDIIISPNIGYRVNTITVNGEPIEFTEEENHIVILNKFINMQENKEVIVTFKKIETSVLVHHYKENTTEQLSKDVTINGEVGDDYTTQVATDIPQNYELVETPAYASGKMTEDQIVVTYYYRLKTPDIANQNINKTGTDRMTVANQEMSYTVTYTANVTDYIGNAEVTIVDTLPYVIDEGKSDLVGGTYDSASKTITWKENVTDLDSYDGKGTVNITKTFKVVYVGLDMNQEKITNNVKGHIKLLTPEKTSEEVTGDQDATIYKAIISSEKLVDKTEAIEGEKVTYTIRITNDGNLEKTVTVRDTLPAGITFDKDTLIQVGDTGTVYTEQNLKNGIPVEVPASGSIDVVFAGKVDTLANNEYSKTLTNQATVDNEPTNEVTTNVTKANITAHKEAEPSSGNKVREGDEITYRIKVRNDGTRAGDVIVKDTIPTGTTFVEGSIKIDNVADSSKTATDLANGITLNVPISTEKVVEFKVRVNKLIDGTKIKNTAYINQNGEDKKVPEEPEHTYVEPKEEQNITKTGTTTIESLDQEITYNINYTAKITDYSGRAIVKLVDKLPYAIDEASSDLAGGTYDAQAQTITWEEPVENIQITEEKEITVNKTIKVVYKDVSPDVVSIKNVVTGHIEYETPVMTSDEVTANATTTTGFTVNIPVSKVWEDDSNKLGQRPTKVVFKLHGSDGSEYIKEMSKPGTQGSTTTQDSTNPNKWNDIFENLPKYDSNNQEIVYTLTEEEKTEGDLKYYDSVVTDKTITNTNKYGKVTVHHYIMNTDGSTTTTRVPDAQGQDVQDTVIEGKEGNPYTTEETKNINEKYELVAEKLPANATGIIEKYNEEKPQEVIYYYRLKPAKVLINYLEKDEDTDDSNNLVLTTQEQIDGYVDDSYNTDTDNRKETIEKDGKTYTLVSDSGNKTGNMTLQDITVTYYYLQNTKATVRYVERDPETAEIVKDLEQPTVKEGLVGDEFVTNEKAFIGYKLVESPEKTTIEMTKEEQTLIYYYEPVYTGLIENHIDDKTGKILETETHEIQVGENYNIPSKEFEGYDLVEEKLPANAEGTMGEEVVTVNYYYIKKAVLEVNYIDIYTNKPLIGQIVDNTKHEGDLYTTEQKTFENYDLVEVPSNASGTIEVETDEEGNITNNRTVVTYYYTQRAIVEEHHIDSLTGKDIEEPTIHNGHVGDEYNIPSKEFLSYKLIEEDEEGNSMLPTNSQGIMTAEKIVVNYYYNQPAKVIVHYVEKATGKELEEINPETGELQSSLVVIEGFNQDEYETTAKEFEYYKLIESPEEPNGTMKVEIVKDEKGNDVVNNTIELYYYYEAKPFNIGVEKEITGIIVNGERRAPTNGKLEKVEIYRKAAEDTSVQVEYKIKVSNTGEISGNATIEENIPEGMSLANNDGTWEEQEGKLIKVIPEIGAGETKEYTVLLNWEQSGNNMGEKANEVKLVETGNVPGFVDNNDKDNTSNANVIISVETGELPIGLILALVALVGLETVTLRYAVVLTKKQKKKINKK